MYKRARVAAVVDATAFRAIALGIDMSIIRELISPAIALAFQGVRRGIAFVAAVDSFCTQGLSPFAQ